MSAERVAKLTEKEREVLRLVHGHLTSKEIAPILGISVPAVDARLKGATRKLGVEDRRKAAILLATAETKPTYEQTIYQPPEVVTDRGSGSLAEPVGDVVREVQQPFLVDLPPVVEAFASAQVEGESKNDLAPWTRVAAIFAIGIGTILSFGILILSLKSLADLVSSWRTF